MRLFKLSGLVILISVAVGSFPIQAEPVPDTDIPGITALPKPTHMNQDELSEFFQKQKKGTPVQLTLGKDKIVNGLFSNYDEYYETIWLVPQGEKGLFTTKGYRLSGIHSAALWDRQVVPGVPQTFQSVNQDYYLMKESGVKE